MVVAFRNWYRALTASIAKTQTSHETVFINVTGTKKKKKEAFLYYQLIPKSFHHHLAVSMFELWLQIYFGQSPPDFAHWQVTLCTRPSSVWHGSADPVRGLTVPPNALSEVHSFFHIPAFYLRVSPRKRIVKVHNDPIPWESFLLQRKVGKRWLWNKQGYHLVVQLYSHISEEATPSNNLLLNILILNPSLR